MSNTASLAQTVPLPGAETGAAEFTAFSYEGRDPVFEAAPPSPTEYYNPILAGFYPDPSICRAGNDYYLINSTFAFYPGIPIFHSTDLVQWNQIGHVLDRPSQLNLDGVAVSGGIFAPAISYHDGLFYVITTGIGSGGNFYVTAKNPAGPWSDPVRLPRVQGIDPSFFFDDDGRAYIVHNGAPPDDNPLYSGHRAIWLWEFDPQTKTVKGEGKIIVNGGTDINKKPSWIEGPHIWKRNGYYYLSAAEGGTGPQHSQVVFRSRFISGPYEPFEANPILTQRDLDRGRANPVTNLGHADFVQTPAGEWWAVLLGVRPEGGVNLGRETFLLPVKWENDWPVILDRGVALPRVNPRPNLPPGPKPATPTAGSFTWRDDFDAPTLAREWNFLRTPRETWWSLTSKPGSLLLAPRPVALTSVNRKDTAVNGNPSFIGRRRQHHAFTATTALIVHPATAPYEAGLTALQNNANTLFLGVRSAQGNAREVFLEQQTEESGRGKTLATMPLPEGVIRVELKMSATGRNCTVFFRIEGGEWVTLKTDVDGGSLSSRGTSFVGSYLGLYARSLAPEGNALP